MGALVPTHETKDWASGHKWKVKIHRNGTVLTISFDTLCCSNIFINKNYLVFSFLLLKWEW